MVQENNFNMVGIDYFRHIDGGLRGSGLYKATNFCFPAFAYLLYLCLYRLSVWPGTGAPNGLLVWTQTRQYQIVFAGYLVFSALLVASGACLLLRKSNSRYRAAVILVILLSPTFLGSGFLTGNSAVAVIGILLAALSLRNQKSVLAREAAMILIAMAAALKIYPAVFGFLYVKEKRWKETVRLIIYGIVFMFLPFWFFGGIPVIFDWLDNIFSTMGTMEYGRIQYISGAAYMLLSWLSGGTNTAVTVIGCRVLPVVFLVQMLLLGITSRSQYRTSLFFTSAMIFFPSNSFRYTLGYMAIPLLFWYCCETSEHKSADWLRAVLYGNIFTIPVWFGVLTGFALNLGYYTLTYVEVWIYSAAYLLLLLEIVSEFCSHLRRDV